MTDVPDPFTLSVVYMTTLGLIRTRRRGSNRLGFAVQLCTLRYSGRTLGLSETPPKEMPVRST